MSSLEDKPPEIKSGQPRRGFWGGRAGALVVNLVLILAIVLSVLWLPPISLGKRLTEGDYLTLGEVAWSVADPDGTQFTVLPEGLRGTLKAKISAVPQADFVQGTAGEDLIAAAESTPSFLDIKSPVYRLALRGEMPTAALLTIPIPNDALPYETLDLYAWSGAGWSWVPSQVLPAEDVIIAQLDSVTAQFDFVVAQTRGLPPVISADLADTGVPAAADGLVVELNPRAFVLTDNGQILSTSKPDAAADASFAIVPILSNVNADGSIRNDLVDNILVSNELRQTHIDAILKAVADGGYYGIEIDYRAVNLGLRDPFSDFVDELADALHQQGQVLAVRVEAPRQIAYDQWETGAFDWARLGRSADALKVPAIPDPQAYVPDGRMEQMIRWALTRLNRQKLQFILSTRSVDLQGENPTYLSYAEAMAPFSDVSVEGGRQMFKAEERVVFALSAGEGSTSILYDEGAQTYWFRYVDDRNEEHTVWLENAASIAYKLQLMIQYNLRGVAFQHLLDAGNDDLVWQVLREYHTRTVPTMTAQFSVLWSIYDGSGKELDSLTSPLSDPRLVWDTPKQAGEYTIVASLSSDGGQTTTVQGKKVVQVAESVPTPTPEPTKEQESTPTPTPEPTPAPTSEPTPTPTSEPTPTPEAKPTAEATVTSTVLNLRAGPGTNYAALGQVRKGDKLQILGKNDPGTWIKVKTPTGTEAWVILTYVTVTGSLNDVAVAEAPAAPTPSAQPTSQPVGPAPAPRPTGFGYGVQAHAFSDLPKVVTAINDMGFEWLKQQVRWDEVEASKGKYGWDGLDGIANAANAAGVKVLFSVVSAPGWSRGGKGGIGPPDNYQDFYQFMGAMAAHFRGRVHAYEIWNEQNLKREWEGAPLSAADYVQLLKGAYQAIKAADPGAIVVSGAPTPTGINDGSWAIDDRAYLQQMYNAGLRYYCDAVGAHPSGYANPPDALFTGGDYDPGRGYDDHPSFFFRNTMEDYYRIMAANGDGGKRIWATEFGWPTVDGMGVPANSGYEFANDINEQQQGEYLVRAYTWSRSWGHAGVMFLWNLNFWPAAGAQNEMAKYGIVRGDWSPRPAYIALKSMPK